MNNNAPRVRNVALENKLAHLFNKKSPSSSSVKSGTPRVYNNNTKPATITTEHVSSMKDPVKRKLGSEKEVDREVEGEDEEAFPRTKKQKQVKESDKKVSPDSLPKQTASFTKLQENMKEKLEGARFRWLNEELYTTPSAKAYAMFDKEPELFDLYHQGFRRQVAKWPVNPVDMFIKYIQSKSPKLIIADFGCGEAKIAQSVPNTVHSFDLCAHNKFVTKCDISNVPLPTEAIDVAIFCLSLMGTNYMDFIKEAHRVLKPQGTLKIAEVKSRFEDIPKFINALSSLGFKLVSKNEENKIFVFFEFCKEQSKTSAKTTNVALKACKYKKR